MDLDCPSLVFFALLFFLVDSSTISSEETISSPFTSLPDSTCFSSGSRIFAFQNGNNFIIEKIKSEDYSVDKQLELTIDTTYSDLSNHIHSSAMIYDSVTFIDGEDLKLWSESTGILSQNIVSLDGDFSGMGSLQTKLKGTISGSAILVMNGELTTSGKIYLVLIEFDGSALQTAEYYEVPVTTTSTYYYLYPSFKNDNIFLTINNEKEVEVFSFTLGTGITFDSKYTFDANCFFDYQFAVSYYYSLFLDENGYFNLYYFDLSSLVETFSVTASAFRPLLISDSHSIILYTETTASTEFKLLTVLHSNPTPTIELIESSISIDGSNYDTSLTRIIATYFNSYDFYVYIPTIDGLQFDKYFLCDASYSRDDTNKICRDCTTSYFNKDLDDSCDDSCTSDFEYLLCYCHDRPLTYTEMDYSEVTDYLLTVEFGGASSCFKYSSSTLSSLHYNYNQGTTSLVITQIDSSQNIQSAVIETIDETYLNYYENIDILEDYTVYINGQYVKIAKGSDIKSQQQIVNSGPSYTSISEIQPKIFRNINDQSIIVLVMNGDNANSPFLFVMTYSEDTQTLSAPTVFPIPTQVSGSTKTLFLHKKVNTDNSFTFYIVHAADSVVESFLGSLDSNPTFSTTTSTSVYETLFSIFDGEYIVGSNNGYLAIYKGDFSEVVSSSYDHYQFSVYSGNGFALIIGFSNNNHNIYLYQVFYNDPTTITEAVKYINPISSSIVWIPIELTDTIGFYLFDIISRKILKYEICTPNQYYSSQNCNTCPTDFYNREMESYCTSACSLELENIGICEYTLPYFITYFTQLVVPFDSSAAANPSIMRESENIFGEYILYNTEYKLLVFSKDHYIGNTNPEKDPYKIIESDTSYCLLSNSISTYSNLIAYFDANSVKIYNFDDTSLSTQQIRDLGTDTQSISDVQIQFLLGSDDSIWVLAFNGVVDITNSNYYLFILEYSNDNGLEFPQYYVLQSSVISAQKQFYYLEEYKVDLTSFRFYILHDMTILEKFTGSITGESTTQKTTTFNINVETIFGVFEDSVIVSDGSSLIYKNLKNQYEHSLGIDDTLDFKKVNITNQVALIIGRTLSKFNFYYFLSLDPTAAIICQYSIDLSQVGNTFGWFTKSNDYSSYDIYLFNETSAVEYSVRGPNYFYNSVESAWEACPQGMISLDMKELIECTQEYEALGICSIEETTKINGTYIYLGVTYGLTFLGIGIYSVYRYRKYRKYKLEHPQEKKEEPDPNVKKIKIMIFQKIKEKPMQIKNRNQFKRQKTSTQQKKKVRFSQQPVEETKQPPSLED